jgi:FtsP/CotA-like multicopper oxidase with cupredoxin domain
VWNAAALSTEGRVAFVNRLAVQGRRVFDLRAAPGGHDFGGRTATAWGFNGTHLGPTLRAARGETVAVNVHNGLTETTTVHWHGVSFRVISADGQAPPPELGGWKDTLYLKPDVRYEILVDLPRYADPHVGQFVVVDPGSSARPPPGAPHGSHESHGTRASPG